MNCFFKVIKNVLGDVSKEELNLLTRLMIGYCLQITTFNNGFSDVIKKRFSSKQKFALRAACTSNFDLVKFKLAALKTLQENEATAIYFLECGLKKSDFALLDQFQKWHYLAPIKAKLKKIGYIPSPDEMVEDCARQVDSLNTWINKFVYRKLRFAAKANGFALEDFANELKSKAVETYYLTVPFKSDLYLENTVKQSMHNAGMNMISYFTAACRARMEDGTGLNTTTSIFARGANGQEFNILDQHESPESSDNESILALRASVRKLMEQAPTKERNVIKLLMFEQDSDFVDHFNSRYRGLAQARHTEDVFDALGKSMDEFKDVVREYVNLRPLAMRKIINNLQLQLA